MTYALYNSVATICAPIAALCLAIIPRYRPLLRRFAPPTPVSDTKPLWVHACSIGEINTARPLLAAIQTRWPGLPIVLTVSTNSGYALATAGAHPYAITWLPFDHPFVVSRFVRRLAPRALVLVETEIWPNLLRECRRCNVPTILVNGRVSDKHFPRYMRWNRWFRPVFQQLSVAAVQNAEYAARFASLGLDPGFIQVTGNTKFDAVVTSVAPDTCARLRTEMGIGIHDPILILGSIRSGDETWAARCWERLCGVVPDLRIIVVPRHIDRLAAILACFKEPILLRSEALAGRSPKGERVLIVDTQGELIHFYALATVAVIGGSFYPGVNGHNPLEPAALGVATVFGPYMRNFADPARALVQCGGARQVPSSDDLDAALALLFADAELRRTMAHHAVNAIHQNQGAIRRTVDLLEETLRLDAAETSA